MVGDDSARADKSRLRVAAEDVARAAAFLFDMAPEDVEKAGRGTRSMALNFRRHSLDLIEISVLVPILLSLAKVDPRNLQNCDDLPFCMSLSGLTYLGKNLDIDRHDFQNIRMNSVAAFDILSNMLCPAVPTKDAVLVSVQGWSLFFDALTKIDPAEAVNSAIRIEPGVPSRRGLRKTRIVNGPNSPKHFPPGEREFQVRLGLSIQMVSGIHKTTRGRTFVGESGADAFQAAQSFIWHHQRSPLETYIFGLRSMLDFSASFRKLAPCECNNMVAYEQAVASCLRNRGVPHKGFL